MAEQEQIQQLQEQNVVLDHDDPSDQVSSSSQERGERFSLREEVVALADSWIADAGENEQERKILLYIKEDVLAAIDSVIPR